MNYYVSVELANEAREIIMFKISRKQVSSEDGRIPNDEGGSVIVP